MARKDYSNVPHFSLIRKDETIEIDSIFQFKGGFTEITEFLNACTAMNCTVKFLNEGITATPGCNRIMFNVYATIAEDPKIAEHYMTYLLKLNRGQITPLE